ncbi:hypothetical protein HPO96_21985 [Kribbella sandramycini]|uniref:Uncharacterized protein n=1 Tax=Kribbella sandramycini TaxID=60450 RepID=A0A7Y4P0R1_9ACTN|nr:hypothetical protein [Kribbella sandramycini]MBB6566420.1 hypothetical protein [Kribbella sandramycini]NOL42921.1 hypothetical protein [Kribbella sandramycini]
MTTTTDNPSVDFLSPLTGPQVGRLVCLALAVVRRLGYELMYRDGVLQPTDPRASGPILGLSNLARAIAHQDPAGWPQAVERHFTDLIRRLEEGVPDPPADPERALVQRLVPRAALPAEWTADRPDFLPGLLSVPAAEQGDVVTMFLNPSDLGLTWSAAEGFGLANLRRRTDTVDFVDVGGVQIAALTGDSFTASRALVIDAVLRDSLAISTPPSGLLVALPSRDLLLIHVIRDLGAIPALGHLINHAVRTYNQAPGPLSPDVHLVTFTPTPTWYPATSAHSPTTLTLSPELSALLKEFS